MIRVKENEPLFKEEKESLVFTTDDEKTNSEPKKETAEKDNKTYLDLSSIMNDDAKEETEDVTDSHDDKKEDNVTYKEITFADEEDDDEVEEEKVKEEVKDNKEKEKIDSKEEEKKEELEKEEVIEKESKKDKKEEKKEETEEAKNHKKAVITTIIFAIFTLLLCGKAIHDYYLGYKYRDSIRANNPKRKTETVSYVTYDQEKNTLYVNL